MADSELSPHGLATGLVSLSDEGEILSADSMAAELLGRPADSLVGVSVFDLLDVAPMPLEGLQQKLREDTTNGSHVGSHVSLRQTTPGGDWYGVVHDLRGISALLSSAARKEAREEARTLISGFAHEVRNPIAAILSMTEALLHSSKCPDSVREMLDPVPGLIRRIEGVISDSVNYIRPNEPVPSRVDVERIISDVLKNHEPPDDVEVAVEATLRVPMIMTDPWHVRRILRELLANAYDAGATRVEVRADAFPENGTRKGVSVVVEDDGTGVDDEVRDQIFRPFFTTRAQQTGLGLASSRNLARLNRGRLEFVGSKDGRTRFELILPEDIKAQIGEVDQHGL